MSPTCNKNEIQKSKFLESKPNKLHCWIKCSFIVQFFFVWQNIAINCCKHEGLMSGIIASWYQILLLLVLQLKRVSSPFIWCLYCSVGNILWPLWTTFDGYILLTVAMYNFRRLYTTCGGYMLLSTAIYYFRRLYTTFNGYILLLA